MGGAVGGGGGDGTVQDAGGGEEAAAGGRGLVVPFLGGNVVDLDVFEGTLRGLSVRRELRCTALLLTQEGPSLSPLICPSAPV